MQITITLTEGQAAGLAYVNLKRNAELRAAHEAAARAAHEAAQLGLPERKRTKYEAVPFSPVSDGEYGLAAFRRVLDSYAEIKERETSEAEIAAYRAASAEKKAAIKAALGL